MEQRVADLIGRMTLEEKAQQLNHLNVGIPRLKVTSQLVEPEHTLQFHQPILVAIERRDPVLASRLITDHLIDAQDFLLHTRQQETSRQLRHHLATGQSVHKRFRKQSSLLRP
jgi:DNA-binding GntR family transcriptional regulator